MSNESKIRVAVLGCGMMGQEHISYMEKYSQISIQYLCDSNNEMLHKAASMVSSDAKPELFHAEKQLLERVDGIDLLVIATPNYMHTPHILRWAHFDIVILVEKPVAISEKQVQALKASSASFKAKIWVAMEYRFIPAIQKLYQLLPAIGPVKKITIRENRFPFLSKVQEWNKDINKTGDTLVEKCCHFFDLFRLLSDQEMVSCTSKVHRGLLDDHYGYDKRLDNPIPIIDSAYVLLDFEDKDSQNESKFHRSFSTASRQQNTLGCLELCMFADGSRHQEEIIVTGLKGRVEAYLPENKVFHYLRPTNETWTDRTLPPPKESIQETIIDCSDLSNVYEFADEIPKHAGHHYCSTAVEWKLLIDQVESWKRNGTFIPDVSLEDGIAAVEIGMSAQRNVSNKAEEDMKSLAISAFASQSCEHLLNLAIDVARSHPHLATHAKNMVDVGVSNEEEKGGSDY